MADSDWPIVDDGPIRDPLATAMRDAALPPDQQQAIAVGNGVRLLGLN